MIPRFLDVEASSLNTYSYPIEIAWSDHNGDIESHLIDPYGVEEWTDWDYNAQQIHGLSRKQCREEGIQPDQLCRLMDKSIQPGEIIYADGGKFDEDWVDTLYGAGSMLGYAKFRIVHSDQVMLPLLMKAEFDERTRWQLFENIKYDTRKIVGARHRATPDVQFLIEVWKMCLMVSKNI